MFQCGHVFGVLCLGCTVLFSSVMIDHQCPVDAVRIMVHVFKCQVFYFFMVDQQCCVDVGRWIVTVMIFYRVDDQCHVDVGDCSVRTMIAMWVHVSDLLFSTGWIIDVMLILVKDYGKFVYSVMHVDVGGCLVRFMVCVFKCQVFYFLQSALCA